MDVGPIARSERKISYGRADREFRCSRAVRDRLDMNETIWGRISGKNRGNDRPARSLCEIAYGYCDRKFGPCLPSAARFSIAHPAALVKCYFAQRKEPLRVQFKHTRRVSLVPVMLFLLSTWRPLIRALIVARGVSLPFFLPIVTTTVRTSCHCIFLLNTNYFLSPKARSSQRNPLHPLGLPHTFP